MGLRGDAIAQFDWSVGELLNTLDRLGLTENTLVILSSDNGPVVDDGYADEAEERLNGHRPSGPWRGNKRKTDRRPTSERISSRQLEPLKHLIRR